MHSVPFSLFPSPPTSPSLSLSLSTAPPRRQSPRKQSVQAATAEEKDGVPSDTHAHAHASAHAVQAQTCTASEPSSAELPESGEGEARAEEEDKEQKRWSRRGGRKDVDVKVEVEVGGENAETGEGERLPRRSHRAVRKREGERGGEGKGRSAAGKVGGAKKGGR